MTDKIQILIEAILKKTTEQELATELKKINDKLPNLNVDVNLKDANKQLDSFVQKFTVLKDKTGKEFELPNQRTKQWSNELGNTIKQVEKIETTFDELTQTFQSRVVDIQREYTDNTQKLADTIAKLREKSNERVKNKLAKDIEKQRQAANKALEDEFNKRIKKQKEASDYARKLIYEEAQERLKVYTNIQKQIEMAVAGGRTFDQIGNSKMTDADYERIWIQAERSRELVLEKQKNTLTTLQQRLDKLNQSWNSVSGVKNVDNLNKLNNEYKELSETIQKLINENKILTEEEKRALGSAYVKLDLQQRQFKDIEKTVEKGFNWQNYKEVSDTFNKITTAQDGFNTALLQNHKLVRANVQETEQYLKINQELQKGNWIKDVGVYVDKATGKMYQFQNAQRNIMVDTLTWSKAITTALKRIAQWAVSGTLIFGTFRQIKEGISYINELDNVLNEIRIVTNKTQQEVNNLGLSYNKLAKEMNVTTKEIASTAADLFRQGLNDSQVEERMKAIIQYAKISSISLEESNKIITATANATGESVKKIIDVFSYLGDATSAGAEEIGEALQKVASTAENSGVSLEKAASWIATISSITRESASTIGTSLKSIISRYEQIKEKGFNEEDATKINDVVKALDKAARINAIDVVTKQLRPFAEVLDELGAKWDTLTQNEKAYVTTTLAGTYQRNRLLTLLNNYSDSLKNYEAALNSAGNAGQKFAIYQESTQAALDKLKTTWEGLWQNTLSSDGIKVIINLGTALLNLTDKIGLLTVALSSLFIYLSLAGKIKLVPIIDGWSIALGKFIIKATGSATAASILSSALSTLLPVAIITGIGLLIKGIDYLSKSYERQIEKVRELKNEYDNFSSSLEENEQKQKNVIDKLKELYELRNQNKITDAEKEELKRLENVNKELERQIKYEKALKAIKGEQLEEETLELLERKSEISNVSYEAGNYAFRKAKITIADKIKEDIDLVNQYTKQIDKLNTSFDKGEISAEEHKKRLDELTNSRKKHIDSLDSSIKKLQEFNKNLVSEKTKEQKEANEDLIKSGQELIISLNEEANATNNINNASEENNDLIAKQIGLFSAFNETVKESAKAIEDYNKVIDNAQFNISELTSVIQEMNEGTRLSGTEVIDLIQKYPSLVTALEKTENGYKINIQALESLRIAQVNEMQTAKQAAIDKKIAVLDSIANIVEGYGIQIEAINSLAEAEAQLAGSNIGLYGLDPKDFDLDEGTYKGKSLTDYWGLSDVGKKTLETKVNIAKTVLEIGRLKDEAKALKEITSDPNFFKGFEKDSESKDSFSEIFDLRLKKIDNINNAIDKLKDKLEDITNIEQKPAIYDQLIEQYKLKEKIIKEVRDSYQKELDSIKFAGKEKILTGDLSNINTTDKDVVATIKRIQEIGSTLSDLDKQLYSIDNDINSLVSDKMSVSFKIFDKSLEPLQNRLEELDYQLKLLDDNDLDGQVKILQEQIKITTDVVSKYESELSNLISTTSETDKQTEWYNNRLDELIQKYRDGNLELKKYNENLQSISFKIQIYPITEAIDDIEYEIDRYNEILKQSSEEKQIEVLVKVNKLLEQEKNKLHELNEARRKQLSLLSPTSEEYKKLQEEIEDTSLAWWRLDNQQNENIKTIGELLKKQQELRKQESADKLNIIKDVEDKIIQIIKKRYEEEAKLAEKAHQDKLKQYDERLDKFRKVINDEIALLEDQFNEEDYQRQLAEEQNKLQEIQSEINKLSLDDSLETRNKIVELTKEKAEQEKRIEELKRNHSREAQKKNLQDQLKDFEEYINDKKAKENEDYENFKIGLEQRSSDMNIYLEAQKALLEGVMYDVNGQLVSLTDAYISFENTFGEGMSILGDKIKNEFIAKILEAQSAVQNLESIMGNYMNYGGSVKNSSSNPLGMSDEDFQTYLENKRLAEQSSSPVVKQALRNKNQQLRDKYGIEEDLFDYNTLLQMTKGYSEGGLVDYTGLAMVHGTPSEPEGFLKHDDLSNLLKVLDFTDKIIHRIEMPKIPNIVNDGFSFKIDNLIAINGNVTKETVPLIQNEGNKIIERLKNEFIKRGIYR